MEQAFDAVTVYRYSLPFAKPLILSSCRLQDREVLLLEWRRGTHSFWTEVSPLPGYSSETLSCARRELDTVFDGVAHLSPALLENTLSQCQGDLLPSVSSTLAAAVFECRHANFNMPAVCPLLTAGDLTGGTLARLVNSPVIKVKVGGLTLDEDIARISQICELPDFTGKLRLDANQRWSAKDIHRLCRKVDVERIEWLEDPLAVPEHYQQWAEFSTIPYALDETLHQNPQLPVRTDALHALILKPTLLGHQRLVSLCEWAKSNRVKTIFSSCFETPIGQRHLYALANTYGGTEAHGIDTLKYFSYLQEPQPVLDALVYDGRLL